MPQHPPFVFLSYAHADKEFAARLKNDLCEQGITVWIDKEEIEAGTREWEETIRDAIRDTRVVLFVASPNARLSPYVKGELRLADMYQRPLYPIWAQGTQWMDAVPLLSLSGAQYIDARETKYETAFHELVQDLHKVLSEVSSPPPTDLGFEPRNPYKGLRPFGMKDAGDFFGRKALTSELIEKLREALTPTRPQENASSFLAVVGSSGSGKSSVVMAGLLPRLQRSALTGSENWVYLRPITPGEHPLEALMLVLFDVLHEQAMKILRDDLADEEARGLYWYASKLAPEGKVVLIIDQFEELFTQTTDEKERKHFIDLLVTAATEPHSPLIVLVTLRADFFDRPMQYPDLYRLIDAHHCTVLPMDYHDLREVITRPAEQDDVQLTFEGDLIGDLLFETHGQIGALPLLEFTLEQLFQQRRGHLLTLQVYREMGGVKGALTRHAEKTYAALPSDEHRRLARAAVFVRLITPGATEQDATRRRAALSEFSLTDSTQSRLVRETIDAFIAARLLTTNEVGGATTIEVSHEALLREWPDLSDWVRKARQDIPLQQTISKDVAEWEQRGKPGDRLYRGSQLKDAQAWATRNLPSKQEVAFLRASAAQRILSLVGLIAVVLLLVSSAGVAGLFALTRPPDPTSVTTLQDNVNGSLRYCINNAPSGSIITFAQSLHGTIKLIGSLELVSGKRLTIQGPNIHGPEADRIIISSSGTDSNIHVSKDAILNISDLSFANSETILNAFLFNEGTLTVKNSIISNNKTTTGGISFGGGIGNGGTSLGGGILNSNTGTLTAIDSIISNNSASGAQAGQGGGIYNDGKLTVTNSTFSNNSASSSDGDSLGGAIDNHGKLTVTNSTFSNNSATAAGSGYGGGIFNHSAGIFTVTNSTFLNNKASGTQGSQGGGIDNDGKLTVITSTFSNNSASSDGGTSYGGGIVNVGIGGIVNVGIVSPITVAGTLTVINSTFSGNSASGTQGSQGGGIDNDGKLTVVASTIANNKASGNSSDGGGILSSGSLFKDSSTIIRFCTIYGNTSDSGGGIQIDPTASNPVTIGNSIVAANSAPDGPDISGALTSDGYNLIENSVGAKGLNARTDGQVQLADLKINSTLSSSGGPTQTLALLQGSPAIDAIPQQACSITITDASAHNMTIITDQRGDHRPDGSENACDIGAYEYVDQSA